MKKHALKELRQNKIKKPMSFWVLFGFCSFAFFQAAPLSWSAEEMAEPITLETPSSSDSTVSMSFSGASLKDVLLVFSQQSGLNVVASQDVESKKVTVSLDSVAPKDALEAIVTANGLSYSKKPGSDIYVVYPAKAEQASLETKVFHLKHARLSDSPLDIGGLATVGDLSTLATASTTGSIAGTSTSSTVTDQNRGIDKLVDKLLSSSGKVALDVRTNSIIVTDTPEVLDNIQKVLKEVDVAAPQVILEVHVLEVDKSLISDQGIDWGGTNGSLLSYRAGMRTTTFPFRETLLKHVGGVKASVNVPGSTEADLLTGADPTDPTTSIASQMTYGVLNATTFAAVLRFISTRTDTKILARPRVLTQNNEAATIKLVTNAATSSSSTTTQTSTTTGTVTREEVGVNLKLTPQINNDNSILLFLEPSVSTIAVSQIAADILDKTTRLVRTIARLKDDQTLVIGGLMNGNTNHSKKKIPLLGDIPGIGKAFSYDSDRNEDRELLIFVTPHIVRGFDSLGDPSSTSVGRDLAVKRMLDSYRDYAQDSESDAFGQTESARESLYSHEQALVHASEKRSDSALMEKQMSQALDALDPGFLQKGMTQSHGKTLSQTG